MSGSGLIRSGGLTARDELSHSCALLLWVAASRVLVCLCFCVCLSFPLSFFFCQPIVAIPIWEHWGNGWSGGRPIWDGSCLILFLLTIYSSFVLINIIIIMSLAGPTSSDLLLLLLLLLLPCFSFLFFLMTKWLVHFVCKQTNPFWIKNFVPLLIN